MILKRTKHTWKTSPHCSKQCLAAFLLKEPWHCKRHGARIAEGAVDAPRRTPASVDARLGKHALMLLSIPGSRPLVQVYDAYALPCTLHEENSWQCLSATLFPCHKRIFRIGRVCCSSSPVGHFSLHINKEGMGARIHRMQKKFINIRFLKLGH